MQKIKYFILLNHEGDFLKKIEENMWQAVYYYDDITLFDTYEEAVIFFNDNSISSIWPFARVEQALT